MGAMAEPNILSRSRVALERAIDQLPLYLGLRSVPGEQHEIEAAWQNRAFQFLIHLAKDLIAANTVGDALARTLDVAFQALPAHRGFVMLRSNGGLVCEIARVRDHLEYRPAAVAPVSDEIIRRVMTERVGLSTRDALCDERLAATDSIWRHGIRAAMCVPLWSGDDVIGVLQVDSPILVGTFSEHDLDFLMALANLAAIAVERIREREIRRRLQRYHAPAMVEQVMREARAPDETRSLKHADVTVMFADIAGFTSLAASMELEQVADVLSGFCSRVSDVVFAEGGTVDKFMGDCVMAFFGAPLPMPDHPTRAVRAGLGIHAAIALWNRDRAAARLPALQARVGLNSGPAIVGDIGSPERSDYTAIGNTVNVAARLEQQIAEPGDIVLGEDTHRQLPPEFECEVLGEVALRGLERGVRAYRVRRSSLESWHMAL
jgi:adenylate cyclase